ncbi:MAG: von Willebrand factor type A domain-containing protein [Bacteroidales bacterium]|nr:von Willebrand factor type A domain-containing protein [Bacteroidales bacterium]
MHKAILFVIILIFVGGCSKQYDSALLQEDDWYTDVYEVHENYTNYEENPFLLVEDHPSSKFWIDADGASFAKCRRLLLQEGQIPPRRVVMTEEFINYFNYDYPEPESNDPVSVNGEISDCPWESEHRLLRIGLKGNSLTEQEVAAANIVLLVDVTGSMADINRLPLLKQAFKKMVDKLRKQDKLTILTYSTGSQVVFSGTSGDQKDSILFAIDHLEANYTSYATAGLTKAYQLANQHFIQEGNNRLILASDYNFLAGMVDNKQVLDEINENSDIFLTVIGVGTDNTSATMMERMADAGNGNFEYLADLDDASKLFDHEFGNFFVVAKDAEVRVDFNDEVVSKYRLIGFEHRRNNSNQNNPEDEYQGEIGSGQTITALYQIQTIAQGKICEVEFECKNEITHRPFEVELDINDEGLSFEQASANHRFAASVASFTLLLRDSQYKGNTSFSDIYGWAEQSAKFDPFGYKSQFLNMIHKAEELSN